VNEICLVADELKRWEYDLIGEQRTISEKLRNLKDQVKRLKIRCEVLEEALNRKIDKVEVEMPSIRNQQQQKEREMETLRQRLEQINANLQAITVYRQNGHIW